jgi:hypothetical protein
MKDLKHLLQTWTKVALNVRLRDRSVKIIQYGCQMIIGYYGHKLSDDVMGGLRNTRRITSTARKAFWLLKSINHIGSINNMLEDNIFEKSLAEKFDFLEQIFLVFYYLFENQIFLSRCQLFNFKEEELDLWCNVSWFGGDVALFCSAGLRLYEDISRRNELSEMLMLEEQCEKLALEGSKDTLPDPNPNPTLTIEGSKEDSKGDQKITLCGHQKLTPLQIKLEIQQIQNRSSDLQLSFGIAVLELGVSMHYIYIWRKLRGEAGCIRDGNVGLMGVVSSALIIYEGYRNIVRSTP